jgi:hypothetical protein
LLATFDCSVILAFVPLAFGRALFTDARPTFSSYYELEDPSSNARARFALSDEPIFVIAERVVEVLAAKLLGSVR